MTPSVNPLPNDHHGHPHGDEQGHVVPRGRASLLSLSALQRLGLLAPFLLLIWLLTFLAIKDAS